MLDGVFPSMNIAAVLQIRMGNRDNFGILIHIFLVKKIYSDPSLEPSRRDDSNEVSLHMFSLRNKINHL